jgi:hypothetical protein
MIKAKILGHYIEENYPGYLADHPNGIVAKFVRRVKRFVIPVMINFSFDDIINSTFITTLRYSYEDINCNFQFASTEFMQLLVNLHHDIMFYLIVIVIFVLMLLIVVIKLFHYKNEKVVRYAFTHDSTFEIL